MSSTGNAPPLGVRILDRLRDDGRLTASQYENLYHQCRRSGERVEEAILDGGLVTEVDLLKTIASLYRTRFVSTERLAKADLDRRTLERLPRRLAERLQCVPILFDRKTQTLSIVAYDHEADIGKQVQVATGVREVRVFAARPRAVQAAILRFYAKDASAFSALLRRPSVYAGALDDFERTSEFRMPTFGTGTAEIEFDDRTPAVGGTPAFGVGTPSLSPNLHSSGIATPASGSRRGPSEPITIEIPELESQLRMEDYLETLNVMVTLLDSHRGELRGHSGQVARLARKIAELRNTPEPGIDALVMAAYLHDIGKAPHHLTALNVSSDPAQRQKAQVAYLAPVRMFESAHLPKATAQILTHLYERYDGQGFPDRLAGKAIPLGSRILAIVETYADLISNRKNPYRKKLTSREAVNVLRQLGTSLFDPVLVDALRKAVLGSEGESGVAPKSMRTRVLLVDPDMEETTVLELRLAEAGHEVVIAQGLEQAEGALAQHRFDLVISEVELDNGDGFAVLSGMQETARTKDVPFVFFTRKTERETVSRGFELGAADFLSKPTSAEIVVAKTAQLIESGVRNRSNALAGNLRDMSLPDVMQALGNGRKTGMLRVTGQGQKGEIHFLDGQIADATFGTRTGEEAIYELLALAEGEFVLDAGFRPDRRVMQANIDTLLLEGMRRIDEAAAK